MPVRLYSDGLLSKWGFRDGDVLMYYLWELPEYDDRDDFSEFDSHRALEELVKTHLLPALDQRVETVFIGTIHNPVRAKTADGLDVEGEWYDEWHSVTLSPTFVDVPDEQVMEVMGKHINSPTE